MNNRRGELFMIRYWVFFLMALLLAAFPGGAEASPIPLRGVVEGFYGTPWSQRDRLDMMKFCGEQGLNAYIYAPKDDPYHRERWREPYPGDRLKKLEKLVQTAKQNGVEFIFAISPGMDLRFDGTGGEEDRKIMLRKLESMYALGVRSFAIFFDDIKGMTEKSSVDGKDAHQQAEFINEIQKELRGIHGDVKPFLAVPTEYFYEDMVAKDSVKPYTQVFARELSPEVTVLYTGKGVVTEGITDGEMEQVSKIYGRKLGIWWNYPVTDYQESKLALGAIVNLPKEGAPALFFNPMKHEELSKIALATGAEYAKNPGKYNADLAWNRAMKELYGDLAEDMKLFASHSRRMENSWARCGQQDGEELRREMEDFWKYWPSGGIEGQVSWFELRRKFREMDAAGERLQKKLPETILSECRPQLGLFRDLAKADEEALRLLRMYRFGNERETRSLLSELKKKYAGFVAEENSVRISEGTARKFLKETVEYVEKKLGS